MDNSREVELAPAALKTNPKCKQQSSLLSGKRDEDEDEDDENDDDQQSSMLKQSLRDFSAEPAHSQEDRLESGAPEKAINTTENHHDSSVYTKNYFLFLLLIPSFVEKIAERMSIPVLPVFATNKLDASPKTVGIIVAFVALGKVMANAPSGWLVSQFYDHSHDNDDERDFQSISAPLIPISMSCLLLASACIGAAHSPTPLALIGARLWEGAGLSMWVIGRQTLMNDLLTKDTRGRYMSTVGGTARVASIIGPFLGGILAPSDDQLQWPFYGQALLHCLNAMLIVGIMLWLRRRNSATTPEEEGQEEDTASLLTATDTESDTDKEQQQHHHDIALNRQSSSLSSCSISSSTREEPLTWVQIATGFGPSLAKLAVFSFCINVTRASRHLLFPLQAMDIGCQAHKIGFMTSITFFMDSSMFPLAGYLMDRHGRKFAGVPALLIMGASLASVPLLMDAFPSSFLVLTIASAGCGIGNGLSSGLLMSMAGDASPAKGQDRAKYFALFRTCADTGLLLGPWVSGMLTEHWSVDVGFVVVAGIALTGAFWMASVMDN